MTRERSTLQVLAKAGFSDLSAAQERLGELGWEPGVFERSADPDASLATCLALRDAHPGPWAALIRSARARDALVVLTGMSQGLTDFLLRRPEQWTLFTEPLTVLPAAQGWVELYSSVTRDLEPIEAVVALRVQYRRNLCQLALFDALTEDPREVLPQVAACLADMAGACLEVALDIARRQHSLPAEDVPLSIIGMGKTGARELNYLSDVDVIYVTEVPEGAQSETVLQGATLLARETARNLMEFGAEPGLWEVDANLRPEGKDGALVRTLESHLA